MSIFLGIDTSNYTSSVAAYDSQSGEMISEKMLLPVKENECGLRQSDAVFLHVKQLASIAKKIISKIDEKPIAIGVSISPCDSENSYMPCFLVGKMVAEILSLAYGVKTYYFSHQRGHIAAALYSANCLQMINSPFLALHISGGTTDLLKVSPDLESIISVQLIGKSLDLKAGQAIDRVGVMLGLSFPCGVELEKLAQNSDKKINVKTCIKGFDCALSGVENIAKKMLDNGENAANIARFCLDFIEDSIDGMCKAAREKYPDLPFVFAGGVMSNKKIQNTLSSKYGGCFAEPKFSSDNAAGIAVLCKIAFERDI